MIPVYRGGLFTTMSLAQAQAIPSITSSHKLFTDRYGIRFSQEKNQPNPPLTDTQGADVILGSDLALLDGKIIGALLDARFPTSIRSTEEEFVSIEWKLEESDPLEHAESRIFISEKHRGSRMYIGIKVDEIENDQLIAYFISGTKYPMYWVRGLWNVKNPLVQWLIKVQDACRDERCDLKRQLSKVFNFLNSYSSGHGGVMNLTNLNNYLQGWRGISQLPNELYPPEIEITEEMFMFLG
jgi:hypothetical protein